MWTPLTLAPLVWCTFSSSSTLLISSCSQQFPGVSHSHIQLQGEDNLNKPSVWGLNFVCFCFGLMEKAHEQLLQGHTYLCHELCVYCKFAWPSDSLPWQYTKYFHNAYFLWHVLCIHQSCTLHLFIFGLTRLVLISLHLTFDTCLCHPHLGLFIRRLRHPCRTINNHVWLSIFLLQAKQTEGRSISHEWPSRY